MDFIFSKLTFELIWSSIQELFVLDLKKRNSFFVESLRYFKWRYF